MASMSFWRASRRSHARRFSLSSFRGTRPTLIRMRQSKPRNVEPDRDAPEWTPEMLHRAIAWKGLKPLPHKVQISIRLDEDIIEWFKAQGSGYQSRINAVLRAYVEAMR